MKLLKLEPINLFIANAFYCAEYIKAWECGI